MKKPNRNDFWIPLVDCCFAIGVIILLVIFVITLFTGGF